MVRRYTEGTEFTLSAFLLHRTQRSPFLGTGDRSESKVTSPLGYLAAAFRPLPRLAVGVAFQPSTGIGANYAFPDGSELELSAGVAELNFAAAYGITEALWVGLSYRPSYFIQSLKQPLFTEQGMPTGQTTELSLSTLEPLGLTLGVHYNLLPTTALAFVYKSRVSAELSGESKTPFGTFDATSDYATPDKFQFGISHRTLADRLLMELQVNLVMYGWLPNRSDTTIELPTGPSTLSVVADDSNVVFINAGVEYWLIPQFLAARAGIVFGPENQNEETPSYFAVYQGFHYSPFFGMGVDFGRLELNAAFGLTPMHGADIARTTNSTNTGRYESAQLFGGLAARYVL